MDTLLLLRDALDQALGIATPTPAWAAAYGYAPDRGALYPADAADVPGLDAPLFETASLVEPAGEDAAAEGAQPAPTDASVAARRRRLSQQQPALPADDAPSVPAEAQGTDDAYGYEYR